MTLKNANTAEREMSDEELLSEALECIYQTSGVYLQNKDPSYERHREEINEVNKVIYLLEIRLGRKP